MTCLKIDYTPEQKRIAKRLARQLTRIAQNAGDNELYMGNGGCIGSMLGGIVTELEDIAAEPKQRLGIRTVRVIATASTNKDGSETWHSGMRNGTEGDSL